MVFVLVIISLLACRNDSGGVSPVGEPSPKVELQKDTEKRKPEDQVFYQPPIAEVSLPSKENKPKKEDWKLIDTYKVNGADLSGVGAVNHNLILLSDTLHSTLLNNIREEYEHNVAQQIYISDNSWNLVKQAKEETIKIINLAGNSMDKDSTGNDLTRNIFEKMMVLPKSPSQIALDFVKTEVKSIL